MRKNAILFAVLLAAFGSVYAADNESDTDDSSLPEQQITSVTAGSSVSDFCFIDGAPPSDMQYSIVRKMKLGKGTYGSVSELLTGFAHRAKAHGADAMINYAGSQRFGFFPWRMVRPVVRGTAISWDGTTKPDCKSAGGMTLQEILAANKGPSS